MTKEDLIVYLEQKKAVNNYASKFVKTKDKQFTGSIEDVYIGHDGSLHIHWNDQYVSGETTKTTVDEFAGFIAGLNSQ